ncbi:MAG: cytochrome C [Pseudomonadota bacterium]
MHRMPTTVLAATLALAAPQALALPDGPGRETTVTVCSACHHIGLIERSIGYTRAQWDVFTAAMVDMSGTPETKKEVLDYLAASFPPGHNPRPATVVAGPLALAVEGWEVPTPGVRPRDPVEAPDGIIWWVGQWGNVLGQLNPETGEQTEWKLPAGAMPHSVTAAPDGALWYTGNKNATIGRFDPARGEIQVFEMPDPAAKDPHTAEFDAEGRLWFTLQHANMIGRLDQETGETELVTLPRAGSKPYGIKIAADGTVWGSCNGAACLLRIDPTTMAVEEIPLPRAGSHARRLDIAPDGRVWWVNSGLGAIGVYDPETGAMEEWDSPSGPTSHPYAIAWFDDAIWYNESGTRPDMLVRFDPARETFQSWAIPSGRFNAGVLRHMRVSRDGEALLLHQTASNRILRLRVANHRAAAD